MVRHRCTIHWHILISKLGARLFYLPIDSPHFNPLSQAFDTIREGISNYDGGLTLSKQELIEQAAHSITAEMAHSWILDCGYNFSNILGRVSYDI